MRTWKSVVDQHLFLSGQGEQLNKTSNSNGKLFFTLAHNRRQCYLNAQGDKKKRNSEAPISRTSYGIKWAHNSSLSTQAAHEAKEQAHGFPQKETELACDSSGIKCISIKTSSPQSQRSSSQFLWKNLETIQNCKRYERLKLENVFGQNLISFGANPLIFIIPQKDTSVFILNIQIPKQMKNKKRYEGLKFLTGGGIGGNECVWCCDEGWGFCGWWWRWMVIWKALKVVLMAFVGWIYILFLTVAAFGRQSVIKWPVWQTVWD